MAQRTILPNGNAAGRGQDHRFRQLLNDGDNAGVAATPLPDGTLSIVARGKSGRVRHAEVLDPDGRPMLLPDALRALASARQQAQRMLDQATDHAVALMALAGDDADLNIAAQARDLGLSRTTLYSRLDGVDLDKPAKSK
jgi:cell division septum initiation protein DivIVA